MQVRLGSEQAGNSPVQTPGHAIVKHSRGFLDECSLLGFRQIMADHFQHEVSIARHVQLSTVGRARLPRRDELD